MHRDDLDYMLYHTAVSCVYRYGLGFILRIVQQFLVQAYTVIVFTSDTVAFLCLPVSPRLYLLLIRGIEKVRLAAYGRSPHLGRLVRSADL